ncbi:BTB/POZ and MATH domain-containing protein 1-like [Lolium rigidum]|uniref:BTB/POZ and MATH domain-containing protein 1-like n=1 Tax=Lolium rigidum TaxID=89674 RepID=UPI001F5D9971|nr:BTB/POZ and MATH domain-containing protein 1-like [Lolium rigidum]
MANACTNLTGVVRLERQFKIDGFSLLTTTMSDSEFVKFRWDAGGFEWEIHCYPSTWVSGKYWVALTFMLFADAGTCNVRARLGCLLVHPRKLHNASHSEGSVTHVFKRPKDCSAKVLLVGRDSLPAPASFKDDYLTVQCTITIVKELPEAAKSVPAPSSNLHLHLGDLLESQTGADVTFLVSGETFAAHKLIIAARSPVFMAEFFGHMREASAGRVVIKDMDPQAFKAMLHFIYTDTVPELDQELEAVAMMAQHLLAAANRYGLDRLKVICEGKLAGGITVETAATTLALAQQHNCSHLKTKCVEFMVSTHAVLDSVVATEGYKHLEASCPSALTSIVISMRGRRN